MKPFYAVIAMLLFQLFGLNAQTTFQQTFDLNQDDEFLACMQSADGGFLFGGYSTGVPYGGIIVKTFNDGTVQWSKSCGGTKITDVVESSTGMIYVAGENNVNGNPNFYVAKLSGNGTLLWGRSFGKSTDPDNLYSLALSNDGGVILSGNGDSTTGAGFMPIGYVVKVDSLGNLVWSRNVGNGNGEILYVTKPVSGGGYLSCGYTGSFGNATESYLVRWDENGNILWTRVFGHNQRFDRIFDFVEKPNGGFFVTGKALYTSTNDNLFIASVDNGGNLIWHHNYSMYDDVGRIMLLQDGNIAVCGFNIDLNLGLYNQSYLIKADTSGQVIWARQYGSGGAVDDKLWCGTETSDGGFLLSGSTYGTGVQRTSWLVRADSSGGSTCRDSALNVSRTTLTIASGTGGTATSSSYESTYAIAQLNATMTAQYFCGGPTAVGSSSSSEVAKVYPMPVNNEVTINCNPDNYDFATLYDSRGRQVKTVPVVSEFTIIDVSDLKPGMYTLWLTGTANISAPVIIE